MAAIFLLRHAQASFGTDNYDKLSALGHRQARVAADFLAARIAATGALGPPAAGIPRTATRAEDGPACAILRSGTLQRQRETAAALSTALQTRGMQAAEFMTDTRLNEIDHERQFSILIRRMTGSDAEATELIRSTRQSSRDYQKLLRRVFLYWQELAEDIQGLESWVSFSQRIGSFLSDLVAGAGRGQDAVVVTSGGVIAGLVQQVLKLPPAGCYPLYEPLRNCSITRLLHDGTRVSLSSYNDSSYLEAKSESLLTYR